MSMGHHSNVSACLKDFASAAAGLARIFASSNPDTSKLKIHFIQSTMLCSRGDFEVKVKKLKFCFQSGSQLQLGCSIEVRFPPL
jgi:hypothetical protein